MFVLEALCTLFTSTALLAPPQDEFHYVHGGILFRVESTDDDKLWTTLTGGNIRYSTDGGATFLEADVPTDVTGRMHGMQFSSDVNGSWAYCVGDGGTLLYSTDEGQTWDYRSSISGILDRHGDPAKLRDVFFTDRDTGWVVGWEHTLLRIDFNATSPDPIVDDSLAPGGHIGNANPEWYQIHGFSNGDWIASADNGWMMRHDAVGQSTTGSTISGSNSNAIHTGSFCYFPEKMVSGSSVLEPEPHDLEVWSVKFEGDTGYAAAGVGTNNGYVFKSTDRGDTWTQLTGCFDRLNMSHDDQTPESFYGVELFGDPDTAVFVGYGSALYHALDSGTAKQPQPLINNCTRCPTAPMEGLALVETINDSDQNSTSDSTDDVQEPFLRDITTSDSHDVAWAVGDFGTVRRSDDDGFTWAEKSGNHKARYEGGAYGNELDAVAFGQLRKVLWTDDGGKNFTLETTGVGTAGKWRDAAVTSDGSAAVLVGDSATFYVRDSVGAWTATTWAGCLPSGSACPPSFSIRSVLYLGSSSVILAGGTNGTLAASSNGGSTTGTVTLKEIGGASVTADIVDMALLNSTHVLYLCSDQNLRTATQLNPFQTDGIYPLELTGGATPTGVPTVISAGTSQNSIFAGNDDGEVFRFDSTAAALEQIPVTTLPLDSFGVAKPPRVNAIGHAPVSGDAYFGGMDGLVQRFDNSLGTWHTVKSAFEGPVWGLEFPTLTDGFAIGQKANISTIDLGP